MPKQWFYEVVVLAAGASKQSVFTYHSDTELAIGSLIKVPLGQRASFGVVLRATTKPRFETKSITASSDLSPLPPELIKLADWLGHYYATPLARVWQTFLPAQPFLSRASSYRPALPSKASKAPTLKLTAEQKAAIKTISASRPGNWLLWGATGSGKTQVYIELAAAALKKGQSSIILVPEISLTPQMSQQLLARFKGKVSLTHSGLTSAQRRAIWQKVLQAPAAQVVVGPRSALFMPVHHLGLIVIDEAHDGSYKQDQSPRYYAPAVGQALAGLHQAKLVMGTATPSLNAMHAAKRGSLGLARMAKPIFRANRQEPLIIDLKERTNLGRSYLLSEPLIEMLDKTLKNGKQSLLFLNRRGSARLALCRQCGWVAKCPDCQIPLILHADEGLLRCHWCGHSETPPADCPECSNLDIKFLGSGTKRLEEELAKLFPAARTERLDRDSFDAENIERLYTQLQSGQIDILVGTQMITKGLDLPGVESVGIVLADNMLFMPDFSASERAFQALYQVSGRAGRREGGLANVIIQTYSPTHPAIQAAAARDYSRFYENEISERRTLLYPPFSRLLKIWVFKTARVAAQTAATDLAQKLKATYTDCEVVGPAPAWQETLGGQYKWQIIIKSKQRRPLVEIANTLPEGWTHDLDPIDLL